MWLKRLSYAFRGVVFLGLGVFTLGWGTEYFGMAPWQIYSIGIVGLVLGIWRLSQSFRSP